MRALLCGWNFNLCLTKLSAFFKCFFKLLRHLRNFPRAHGKFGSIFFSILQIFLSLESTHNTKEDFEGFSSRARRCLLHFLHFYCFLKISIIAWKLKNRHSPSDNAITTKTKKENEERKDFSFLNGAYFSLFPLSAFEPERVVSYK